MEKMKRIVEPGPSGDGINIVNQYQNVENVHVDFSEQSLKNIDECIGITMGASAIVEDCIFEGAEKIALIGSGDKEYRLAEKHKAVVFKNCTFRKGSRRMPEVQSGMCCLLLNCLIEDWAEPSRQPCNPRKARGFGAWAHDEGYIVAVDCQFVQRKLWKGLWHTITDVLGHVGNAVNEGGIKALFDWHSWIPGAYRGLTATDNGNVMAINCTKSNPKIIVECERVLREQVATDNEYKNCYEIGINPETFISNPHLCILLLTLASKNE